MAKEVARVEREMRVKFPKKWGVKWARKMRHEADYASFQGTGTRTSKGVRFASLKIRVFGGTPLAAQRIQLRHELREIGGVMKGERVQDAHIHAVRSERKDLKELNFKAPNGKPLVRALPLLKRLTPPGSVEAKRKGWLW